MTKTKKTHMTAKQAQLLADHLKNKALNTKMPMPSMKKVMPMDAEDMVDGGVDENTEKA